MAAFERNSLGDKGTFVAGKYSFGAAAVMAAYDYSRKSGNSRKSRAATLGATYRVGRTTLKAGYGHQRLDGAPRCMPAWGTSGMRIGSRAPPLAWECRMRSDARI